jgi:hypothetical protein
MKNAISKIKIIRPAVLIAILALAFAGCQKSDLNPIISDDTDVLTEQKVLEAPDVPEEIAVPDGNKLIWHCYASGVQIYEVTESTIDAGQYVWTFVAPSATLSQKPDFTRQVGSHYVGPTWQATIGPKKNMYVVGTKLTSVTEDVTAVPWLLLQAVPVSGPGYLHSATLYYRWFGSNNRVNGRQSW